MLVKFQFRWIWEDIFIIYLLLANILNFRGLHWLDSNVNAVTNNLLLSLILIRTTRNQIFFTSTSGVEMNTKLEYHLPAFQILERNGKNLQNIVEIMKMVTVEHILLRNYREQHLSWTVYFSGENSRNKISSPKQTALSWS